MSVDHYENFPVASILCPARLRPAVRAIYAFARTADDIADEGEASADERRAALTRYRAALHAAADGHPSADWPRVFGPLAAAIERHQLPRQLFDDLLDAFVQDCAQPHYRDRSELLDYCRRSANPIGRLLLALYEVNDAESLAQSDAICSALQLINFWQDPSVDLARGRNYFPGADARRHGLALQALKSGQDDPATQALLRDLARWAEGLMLRGAPLALRLPGRVGWELRLVVQGGLRILEKIAAMQFRTLSQRPTLGRRDWALLLWRAARMRSRHAAPGWAPR